MPLKRGVIPNMGDVSQATRVHLSTLGRVRGNGGTRRRKRRVKTRKATRSAPRRGGRRGGKRPARLVKGSAAAKRYMASIRRKRKR
jgi:hypothetical protein